MFAQAVFHSYTGLADIEASVWRQAFAVGKQQGCGVSTSG